MTTEVGAIKELFNLKDSKFFELCRSIDLMNDLVPDIRVQMIAEAELQELAPRNPDIGIATRILVNYTNEKGNSSLFQIVDSDRLEKSSTINIDEFLGNYDVGEIEDPIIKMKLTVVSALTYSLVVCLGISDEKEHHVAKALCKWFVKSCISVIYNDPLDILILLKDKVLDNNAVVTIIDKIWVVKVRPHQGV